MTSTDVAQINQRLDALSQTVTRLDEAIRGNGRDGIRQQMTELSTVQGAHAAAIQSLRSTRSHVVRYLLAMAGSALAGAVAMGLGGQ